MDVSDTERTKKCHPDSDQRSIPSVSYTFIAKTPVKL